MSELRIGKEFKVSLDDFITLTQAILARKRSGKSYTASVQAEELLRLKQQVGVIDPTGAWWGLRSSDIEKLGREIAASVERVKQESPEFLKQRIAELEAEATKRGKVDSSTGFVKAMSRLRSLGYIDYAQGGMLVATTQCFLPEGR